MKQYIDKVRFSDISNYKTGGLIRYYLQPESINELLSIDTSNTLTVGGGSNILASDNYYNGTIINLDSLPKYILIHDDRCTVTSNYSTTKLPIVLNKLGYSNLEYLAGIPGTIGGATHNNSGAFGKDISDYLIDIKYISNNELVKGLKYITFNYRYSTFKELNTIILDSTFKIKKHTTNKIEQYLEYRKQHQKVKYPNCGSVFTNTNIEAWKIIDKLSLRGFSCNGARFSYEHANFIENYNNATSKDIYELILKAQQRAKQKNHTLNIELNLINFD